MQIERRGRFTQRVSRGRTGELRQRASQNVARIKTGIESPQREKTDPYPNYPQNWGRSRAETGPGSEQGSIDGVRERIVTVTKIQSQRRRFSQIKG